MFRTKMLIALSAIFIIGIGFLIGCTTSESPTTEPVITGETLFLQPRDKVVGIDGVTIEDIFGVLEKNVPITITRQPKDSLKTQFIADDDPIYQDMINKGKIGYLYSIEIGSSFDYNWDKEYDFEPRIIIGLPFPKNKNPNNFHFYSYSNPDPDTCLHGPCTPYWFGQKQIFYDSEENLLFFEHVLYDGIKAQTLEILIAPADLDQEPFQNKIEYLDLVSKVNLTPTAITSFQIECVRFALAKERCTRQLKKEISEFMFKVDQDIRDYSFKQPNLRKSKGEYIIQIRPCSKKGIKNSGDGRYQPNKRNLWVCVKERGLTNKVKNTLRHEYFHAIQRTYALQNWKADWKRYNFWFLESMATIIGGSRMGEVSELTISADSIHYLRVIDKSLYEYSEVLPKEWSKQFEYQIQDFWVYLGKKYKEHFGFFKPFLENGPTTQQVNKVLIQRYNLSLGELYWEWAKNQAYEHTQDIGKHSEFKGGKFVNTELGPKCSQNSKVATIKKLTYEFGKTKYQLGNTSEAKNLEGLNSLLVRVSFPNDKNYHASMEITSGSDPPKVKFYEARQCNSAVETTKYTTRVTKSSNAKFVYILISNINSNRQRKPISIGLTIKSQNTSGTPNKPTLRSPGTSSEPGPILNSRQVTFNWSQINTARYYELYVRNITTGVLEEKTINGSSNTSITLPLTAGHKYRWNMQAFNSAGRSGVTVKRYFQIARANNPLPNKPTLRSPGTSSEPGPTLSSTNLTFNWNRVSNATRYELYLRDITNSPNGPLREETINGSNNTSITLPVIAGHKYRWNMQAFNSAGRSGTTSRLYFQIRATSGVVNWQASPSSLRFEEEIGNTPRDQDVNLCNNGTVRGNYSISRADNWFDISRSSGSLDPSRCTTIEVDVDKCTNTRNSNSSFTVTGESDSTRVTINIICTEEDTKTPTVEAVSPSNPPAIWSEQVIRITGKDFAFGAGVALYEYSIQKNYNMDSKAYFINSNTIELRRVVFGTPAGNWAVQIRNYPGTSNQENSNWYVFTTRSTLSTNSTETPEAFTEKNRWITSFEELGIKQLPPPLE